MSVGSRAGNGCLFPQRHGPLCRGVDGFCQVINCGVVMQGELCWLWAHNWEGAGLLQLLASHGACLHAHPGFSAQGSVPAILQARLLLPPSFP